MAEVYYKKVTRVIEYYVILCFVLITFVPLLHFAWVPSFTRIIYFTGFPLLILLILGSFVKESIIHLIEKLVEEKSPDSHTKDRKK